MKIATCAVEYGWSEYHKESYVVFDYCGGGDD